MSSLDTIDGKAVKNLAGAHALNGAVVFGQPGGFAVLVKYGVNERAVAAQRSRRMRIWRNLNTAAAYVRDELGLAFLLCLQKVRYLGNSFVVKETRTE